MNRLSLVLISSVALMFAACGDSGDAASPQSYVDYPLSSTSSVPGSSSIAIPMSSGSGGVAGTIASITDSRDGQSYKIVTIGSQTWMAENLNYKTERNSYCYNREESNCSKYGRLYTWAAAMDSAGTWSTNGKGCGFDTECSPTYPVRGICPSGWHLPTNAEFETLFTAVGGQYTAGTKLKSTSGWNWYSYSSGNGTDDYSFSALPAGCKRGEYYEEESYDAYFWSSTEYNGFNGRVAFAMLLNYTTSVASLYDAGKTMGYSVRCVQD